jgi:hypothetical protein
MIPVFTGIVKDGFITYDNTDRVIRFVRTLEGKRIDITFREHKSKRSTNQNNYYFGVVCKILGDYFGYTEDEMHEALKIHFLSKGACDVPTVGSTAKMNTAEFEDYLTKIKRWAASEYSVVIPDPNEIEAPEVTPNRYPELETA